MMKNTLILIIILLITIPSVAQKKQEPVLKREVTLYNPYKPSLPDVVKKGYLPDMTDTAKVRPDFKYDVTTIPFMPSYNISTIKPATLIPDPLPRLYNSYLKFGLGNYVTPLAEISISSKRSKNGTIGIFARHFSSNGKVELQNLKKAFAGYMDNDASVYGRKILTKSVFESSVDFNQKTRYAYGYDTAFTDYDPGKKDIRLSYYDIGANVRLVSSTLDSSNFAYDFHLAYNFFHNTAHFYQQSIEFRGLMAKSFKGFYMGSGLEYDYYKPSDSVSVNSKYIFALSPFIQKRLAEWNVRLGALLVADKGLNAGTKFHVYPDINFSFSIVPTYVGFFAGLTGKLEKNQPMDIICINSFVEGKRLYDAPNTDYSLIVQAGLTGETGTDGRYKLSASYSVVNDMLFFTNSILINLPTVIQRGNYFTPITDQAEIFNIHGDIGGKISDKLSFDAEVNYFRYTLSNYDYAWNRPDWDAKLGLKYNLRDKIIADLEVNALGMRRELVTTTFLNSDLVSTTQKIDIPWNLNFSLGAEYRYTKVLSFWLKFNNMTFSRYYEWAYYPSLRFLCMVGFTYSL